MEVQENPTTDSIQTIEALAHLDTAINLNPENPVPVFNMGVTLRNLGQLEESLIIFEKAIEIEERQPLAILHMAEVNYELERWEEAIRLAKLALIRLKFTPLGFSTVVHGHNQLRISHLVVTCHRKANQCTAGIPCQSLLR
jgi:tetratricopeptide (TPR) repeat protein